MISQFAVLVILLGAVNQGMAACQDKPPMANYTADLVAGKFYLIATKPAFSEQGAEQRCGTSYIEPDAPTNFDYIITEETSDGTIKTMTLNATNLSPPGTWMISSADGALNFKGTTIGAKKDKVHIFYACNAKSGKEGVWVYYYKRVNGINEVDSASRQYAIQTLSKNNISIFGFKVVNNKNCTN